MNENAMSVFSFGNNSVRVTMIDNEPWFVAKDVASILCYSDTQAMTRRLDEDEQGTCTDKSSGQGREMTIINESGLYNAILGSNKPDAKRFKKWVTGEVLPEIRQNGGYMVSKAEETPEEQYLRAMNMLKATVERQKQQLANKDQQLQIQAPVVEYAENVLNSSTLMTTNTIATHLGISANALNKFLDYHGWIYKQGKTWYPSFKIKGCGYCDFTTHEYKNPYTGEQETSHLLKWTETGRKAVIELWNKKNSK